MGGLGNQLFQIFTTISYAIKHKQNFVFLQSDMLGKRKTYWKSFLKYLFPFTVQRLPKSMHFIKETEFAYNDLPAPTSEHIFLNGYFQSYRYFDEYTATICRFIKLEDKKAEIKKKVEFDYENMISMHFRLGDYKNLQNCHPVLKVDYYRNALKEASLGSGWTVLYFCEAHDNIEVEKTIRTLSSEFVDLRFLKAPDNLDDWEQMIVMSLCSRNIIANSSFSWWSAWLGDHSGRMVIAPTPWFVSNAVGSADLLPSHWCSLPHV
jgi:hypothetical protein